MKRRTQAEKIADLFGSDIADIREGRYQKYESPKVYVVGDNYYAASETKPRHNVGQPWQALKNFRDETIWESKVQS